MNLNLGQAPPLGVMLASDGSVLLVAAMDCVELAPGLRVYDCQTVWAERLSSN